MNTKQLTILILNLNSLECFIEWANEKCEENRKDKLCKDETRFCKFCKTRNDYYCFNKEVESKYFM